MSESREFLNPYQDWNPDLIPSLASLQLKIQHAIRKFLSKFSLLAKSGFDDKDSSVYTGTSGFALLYYHLNQKLPSDESNEYLSEAVLYLKYSLKHLNSHRISFLCGAPGSLAVAAVIYNKLDQQKQVASFLRKLVDLCPDVLSDSDLPDELLYGRVGYLYALLFLKRSGIEVDDNIVKQVVDTILKSGKKLARSERHKCPLMYKWHDKHYIGAAHGIAGILYLLMEAKTYVNQSDLNELIKPTVDYVLSLQFTSGNFPSSLGNSSDRLIHWCHGAPGVIHMFLNAFKVFDEEKYKSAAIAASNVIWERGLLRKGYGTCHGVAGNGYAFLHMYQIFRDQKYLYRALKFAEWCVDGDTRKCRTPDRPLSLFEGLAGVIYFLVDIQDPETSKFPAFQL